ncbi:MAG: hypothetical protein Fur0032_06440 [Terrimicrobiaceae bacterium]
MAGVYTDNQPDFSYLQPFETKTFTQCWWPIQKIGPARNANTEAAVSLDVADHIARLGVASSKARQQVLVRLERAGQTVFETRIQVAPGKPWTHAVKVTGMEAHTLTLRLLDASGQELIRYTPPAPRKEEDPPPPATEPPAPADIVSADELFLTGEHLEQYRHPTREPEDYWREALRRDHYFAALELPENLGEARHLLAAQADIWFRIGEAHDALGFREEAGKAWARAASEESDFAEMSVQAFSPMTYYRALSLRRLGRADQADQLLRALLTHALGKLTAQAKIDYFATSLPLLLVFEDDLQKRQCADAHHLAGLACRGLGQEADVSRHARELLARDPAHPGLRDLAPVPAPVR